MPTPPATVRFQWELPNWYDAGEGGQTVTGTVRWTNSTSGYRQPTRVAGAILSGWIGLMSDSGFTWGNYYPRSHINYRLTAWDLANPSDRNSVRFSMNPRGNITRLLPRECCVMLRLVTGETGRGANGFVFLPWVSPGHQDKGLVPEYANTVLQRFKTAMRSVSSASGRYTLVKWDRPLSRPGFPFTVPVLDIELDRQIRWRRRNRVDFSGLT